MDKEKEIEEMSHSVCGMENKPQRCSDCMWKNTCVSYLSAERYYNAGYRKANEVRKETAKEILKLWYNENMARLRVDEAEFVAGLAKEEYGVEV